MSNPVSKTHSNPETSSWMRRMIARLREGLRMNNFGGGAKLSNGLTIALVLCGLAAGTVYFMSGSGKKNSNGVGTLGAVTASRTQDAAVTQLNTETTAAVAAKVAKKPEAKVAAKKQKTEGKSAQVSGKSKEERELDERAALGIRQKEQVQLSPGGQMVTGGEEQGEGADTVRARGNWFFEQRAYPQQHIPPQALEDAIRQRDLMKQAQKGRNGAKGVVNAQGIISFPGDALWHLMGPQPVNELFSANSGFPTASGRVTAIAVDPSDANGRTVYIGGAAGGVWKTTNGDAASPTWTPLTDTQVSLAVGSIAIDPNSCTPAPCKIIYVGTGEDNFNGDAFYGAGILKSTDAGNTWTQVGAANFAGPQSSGVGGAKIGAISVQPGNSNVVLASVFFFDGNDPRGGVWQSLDAGATWHQPTTGGQGAAGTGVVFESTNQPLATGATAWAALGDVFAPSATNNGIWKSTDSGAHWTKQTGTGANILPTVNVGRITLGYAPITAGGSATVYAAIADSSSGNSSRDLLGFFKTTDGGTNWTKLTNAPNFCNGSLPARGQCFYDMTVGVHPTNSLFVVVGGGAFTNNSTSLFKSIDGGTNWTTSTAPNDFTLGTTSTRPHVDTHAFAFAANGATPRLYVGNDGGVWRTDDPTPTPPTWVDLNAGLAITQFYPGPSAAIGDENYGFGGTQDNDTELFSGNLAWDNVFACGDGGFTAIDPTFPTSIYTTCDSGASHVVRKSVFNGSIATGQTFNPADAGINRADRAQFIPPLTLDQSNSNTLYFGTCQVYQTTDGGNTWNSISGDLSTAGAPVTTCPPAANNPTITTMDVARQNSSVILAGTSNGKVWETISGGAAWNEIDTGLPNRHVTSVRTKSNDGTGQIAYVTFSGFDCGGGCGTVGHVFKTINGGGTWTNITGDLPDIPVNDIIVDHQGQPTFDALYIATDVGVFSCPDPEAATPCTNWTVVGDGLPNSPVLGLAMRPFSRILRAATHGRSMWNIQLSDQMPPAQALLSSLTPAAVKVGAATTIVSVMGANFSANTLVLFDGVSVGAPTFINTTQLTVNVNSSLFTDGHVFAVTLSDPAGTANSQLPFTVMNPILNAVSMTPGSTTVGTTVNLHFTGSNFVNSTTVFFSNFPGFPLPGGVASAGGTVFDVPVPAFLLTTATGVTVTATNPLPGGGPNPPFSFAFTINPNPNPVAVFNPSPIVLGPIPVTANTSLTTLAVQNTGGGTLTITAATLTGTNAANFAFVAATSAPSCNFETTGTASVAAGGSCFFGIKFTAGTPPGQSNSVATLNVTDNSGGTAGTIQHISVTGIVGPIALIAPVNFGAVTINTTSPTMNTTVFSIGGNTTVTSVGISGTNAADFKVVAAATGTGTNPACGSVPFPVLNNTQCDIGLQFTPSIVGNETATISIADDAVGSPQSAQLFGVGVEVISISPSIVATGGPAFTLTVNGGGFAPSAVVNVSSINGTNVLPRLTTFVNANQLLASIPASDITTAGSLAITVTTPVPGGTTSEPKTLIVAQAPPATNDNISFATNAGTPPFRMTEDTTQATVNTGGIADPTPAPACVPVGATQNGKARSVWFMATPPVNGRVVFDTRFSSYTTIVSGWTGTPGSLVAVPSACVSGNVAGAVPASQVVVPVTGGTKYYMMVSDASLSGAGGTLTFSLDFQPTPAPGNDDNTTPTVIASAPFSGTGNSILATPNTNGNLDPALPVGCATGAASSGQANSVWYRFTASGNGTITADTLTSPYDTILNVTSGTPAGTPVTCNNDAGAGIAQSQVSFAATSGTTYFFMVSSFLGDGGTTNFHLTFSASAGNPVPTITSLSPTSATAGGAGFTLTVNGTGFISTSLVNFNGAARTTTFVSATQITAAITAADIATAGTKPVTVTNPAPGGGTSSATNFTVNNPAPTITTLSPSSATAGGAAFTLTVNGTGFVNGSVVNFNAAARTTTFVSATQVTAAITAADILTAGTFAVTVTNAAPGGGTSAGSNFTVNNPAPTITSLSPTGATAGGAAFTLTVNGTGFVATSSVKFNGTARTTTFVSATQVTAAILAADIAAVGSFPVTVTNAAPGGGTSAGVNFNVSAANNPVPTLTSISPTNAIAGGAAFTLTLTGTNFVATSTVNFGANPALTPTSQTATQLQVTVPAGDIATAGAINVTVTNPAPGGGTTAVQTFTVNNPAPTITTLSPSSATAGGAAFTLTVNGAGFVAASAVKFNGNARTTTFVSATQITAAILAADIATAGTFPVTVTNAAPGGGTSAASNFTVNNPAPTITTLSPTSATAGGAAFTLTVSGTGFVAASAVNFAGAARTTTFVSATQITAAITAADIATAGTKAVTVTNPAPGGGTSAATNFTVNNPVPTITTLSPSSATAGGVAFTLTVNGTNFVSGASATFGGTARTTTFVSATQVTVAVLAADIATAGSFPVVVTNPAPGGGASAAASFTVNNPAPTITTLSPASATAGGAAFTLTVNGTNFVAASVVNFAGAARTTTFVSATQITAAITAADIATAGTKAVTVTNPAPGGGTSAATNFTVNNPAPTITTLSPSSATAGGAAFTLTVNGTNFVAASVVNFSGAARTTTFVSATQITAAITAADIATAGTKPVTVTNPAPGGGTSVATNFTVNNPVPTITTLSPTSATAGAAAFTLTVNGTNFVATSVVNFNGLVRATTFVSGTQITAAITAADIATAGTKPVTVTNPAPGGGTSAATNFTVNNPVPTITTLVPSSATAGGVAFTLTVNGTNFVSGASATFGGTARTTTFVNATQVTVAVTAADIATAGTFPVVVTNPAPGGGASAGSNFTVNNPAPTISSLAPTGATAGGAAFTLTVNGTGFLATSVMNFSGAARTTTFVSATQITAAITAADIATTGAKPVTVTNPTPGGGTSTAVNFNVSTAPNPGPTLTSISPTSGTAGGAAFTLTLTGTNFISASTVNFNGAAKTTTFVSATQITAAITAGDIAAAGADPVTVTNPAPGGGTTAAQTFTVNNPAPTITALSPTSAIAGGAGFTLTVNGTGFVAASAVKFNGNAKTTAFVSATQITAAITAADIATAGVFPVTVTNAAPGGGTSGAANFTVNNPAPTITTLSPASASAGGAAFTLTVNGTGFVAASVVNFNGAAKTTTFVSSTQVTAAVAAADIVTAGTFPVTVTSPAPGGGTSTASNFAVNNPVPTITSLNPTTVAAGGAAFTLTVNGTNFVATSAVKFNGTARTTTFVSATQVTVAILASDIATSGNANVSVTNPAPGGGTTTNFVFVISSAPNPAPTLTLISPTSGTLGQSVVLTLTGTNFITASVVNFGSNADSGGVVSNGGNTLTITISAAQMNVAGAVNVTVTNPAPGGGTTAAQVFTVNNPAPTITTIAPATAVAGGAAFTLTVNGTGFLATSQVKFNGNAKTTTFVNTTQVTAAITAADISATGNFPVTVTNPTPGGGTSGVVNFSVTNPPPVITTLSPTSATAGGVAFTLSVNGTGFVTGATVNFNGAAKTTTFVSATQVTAAILATDIANGGIVNVTVTNPAPGGGTSAAATFTINNVAPTITTLSPTNATAGGAAFTLTVNGTNFVTGSVVNFNGVVKTTTFVSATQVTAAIAAADIATATAAVNVTVTNPAPGGGTSAAATFTINNPLPAITTISPTSATAGGAAFTLTVNGTNFVTTSVVQFGIVGVAVPTTFVNSAKLTATIPASAIASAGPSNVAVVNPAPGGGNSGPTPFTINNPVPTITAISPTSATAGGAGFTLTVTGTGFFTYTIVNWNGANRPTTFVSSTQLTAAIPATDIISGGTATITAFNPPPVGGTSTGQTFTINNAQPLLTSLSPASANAGGVAFTLTVNGSKFVTGAVVSFNGSTRTTTFVSTTQVTAAITAADIATGGTFNVTLTNPAPSAGPSAPLPFAVNNPAPTVTSATVGGKTHAAGGAGFTVTVNGTLFVSTSVVNFNGKAEPTTFVNATQLTAAIPASDVATAGNVNITVMNPAPGGGTTAATVFTVDGITVSGPANTPVKAGMVANITITVTPTILANGFANAVTFSVIGLPKNTTATFTPTSVTPNGAAATTTLMVTTKAGSEMLPMTPRDTPNSPLLRLIPVLWLAALLAGFAAMRRMRWTLPRRRYAAIVPLALLLVTGAVLAGCAGFGGGGTPKGAAQLSVTATSGTMSVVTAPNSVTLTVQ